MDNKSFARLLLLSAIWGGSFLLTRIGAPVLGPVALIYSRVGLAALFLLAVTSFRHRPLNARAHWRHYLVLGFFNSALPFLLFAYAAQILSASLLSILNASSPIWGALIGAAWSQSKISRKTTFGLVLGIVGVALLVGLDRITVQPGAGWAVVAALGAAFSYGVATTYAKAAKSVEPFANAHGCMWAATLLITPAVPFFLPAVAPGMGVMVVVLVLGIVCSGVAYLLYFRLIADIGPTSALTVTFLIPVFGILGGWLFLDEAVGWHTIAGSVIVILGTALVTGFSPQLLFARKTPQHVG